MYAPKYNWVCTLTKVLILLHGDKFEYQWLYWFITAVQLSCLYMYFSLINNSSSIKKGDPNCVGVWISHHNLHINLRNLFSIFLLVFFLIKKIHQSLVQLCKFHFWCQDQRHGKCLRPQYAKYSDFPVLAKGGQSHQVVKCLHPIFPPLWVPYRKCWVKKY